VSDLSFGFCPGTSGALPVFQMVAPDVLLSAEVVEGFDNIPAEKRPAVNKDEHMPRVRLLRDTDWSNPTLAIGCFCTLAFNGNEFKMRVDCFEWCGYENPVHCGHNRLKAAAMWHFIVGVGDGELLETSELHITFPRGALCSMNFIE
jgi:hypothetical protein